MDLLGFDKIPKSLLAGVAVIVLGGIAAACWVFWDRSVVLFDKLDAQALNAVSADLDRAGIGYRIDRESGAITVDPKVQQQARLAVMASQNAFRESVGFELFDGSDFGMTEFAQKINHQRAIEGELARTISALDEVKYARVHLVLPEHGLFKERDRKPRAAITVFTEAGRQLSAAQIRGLQRIATAAVPELEEDEVTVTDETGRVLSAATEGDGDLGGDARLAYKQTLESYLAEKVRGVLGKALGAERFAVSVDVSLDFDRRTTRTERVLDAGAGSSVSRLKESSKGEGSGNAGDHQKEIEYSVGRELDEVAHAAGTVRRIQVGVIVDRSLETVDLEQLRELVSAAVGADGQRGDKITVLRHGAAFQQLMERAEKPAAVAMTATQSPASPKAMQLWIAAGAVGVLAVLTLLLNQVRVRREQARVQSLRLQLKHWVEAESAEVVQHERA